MRGQVAVAALAVLLAAGSWWWIAREPSRARPGADGAADVRAVPRERSSGAPSERASGRPSQSGPRRSRAPGEGGDPEAARARSDPARRNGGPPERSEASSPPDPVRAWDPEAWIERPPDGEDGDRGDAEEAGELAEFGRFKERLALLRALARQTAGRPAIDADAAGLEPDDLDRMDLDRDRALSYWELETARRLAERAEKHPLKNDLDDGAYPVALEDYGRERSEFEAVDTNGDGWIHVDEYYAFLFDTERTTVRLDADGDRALSRDEAGLSEDEFASLDRDGSGSLVAWEIRRAVALGVLERDSD